MWIVHRCGSPDPGRHSAAIHFDDPKQDRNRRGELKIIAIEQRHRELSLDELLRLDQYALVNHCVIKPYVGS